MLSVLLNIATALQVPIHSVKRPLQLKSTGSTPLELSNYYNELYYFNILVGSSNSELSVMIDTGSKYLWLPNTNCGTCEHAENFYNTTASTTTKSLSSEYTFNYGKASVTGTATEDSIKLAEDNNLELKNFAFLSVSKSSGFGNLEADGILGLAFEDKTLGFKNFVEELKTQGKIDATSFSLYLNNNYLDEIISTDPSATIIFGEYDLKYANENFKYVKIDKSSGYWVSSLDEIKVDILRDGAIQDTKSLILTSRDVVFHTGSYMIKVPSFEYGTLMNYITEDYSCYLSYGEIYCFCASLDDFPLLRFNIGNKEFDLEPEYYVQNSLGVCRIMLVDAGETEYIVLGLPFLRRYYSYFDYDRGELGLASAVKAYKVVYSTGNYLTVASFALLSTVLGYYLYKNRKPAKEALL